MAACWSRANIRQRLPGKPRAHTVGGRPSSSLGVKSLTLGGQDLWNRERPWRYLCLSRGGDYLRTVASVRTPRPRYNHQCVGEHVGPVARLA
jgi:hypothetical protein